MAMHWHPWVSFVRRTEAARFRTGWWEGCGLEHSGAGGWAGWNWCGKVKSWQGEVVQGEVTRQARSSSP